MEIRSYSKFDIAVGQIETAITLYLNGGDSFSALTLAGASDELLGKFLKKSGKTPAIESLGEALADIKKIHTGKSVTKKEGMNIANQIRNSVKHMNIQGDEVIQTDPKYAAHDMIMRCISNYHQLTQHYTDNMLAFLQKPLHPARKA
jgi:hypothetical protein